MALFKFRWPGQKEHSEPSPVRRSRVAQAESVDDMRRRARHRLIGAAVLVVLGVIGFPLLFDTQPRPIPVDVPIEIPDRNQVAPLMVPGKSSQVIEGAPVAPSSAPAQGALPSDGALSDGEELVSIAPPPPPAPIAAPAPVATPVVPKLPEPPRLVPEPPVVKPVAKVEPKPEPVQAPAPAPVPAKRAVDEAARARALLEGRPSPVAEPVAAAASKEGRFIVQVGAFAEVAKANEVRSKLERSGLKTYTQVVDTKDGKRTRVRVGPYEQRGDADAAASRIKGLGLAASVLTL